MPIDKTFIVASEALFLPADPSASFAETANCRCDVRFTKEVEVEKLPTKRLSPLNISKIAYGEFRVAAWRYDKKIPKGLADAIVSAGMACMRGNPCHPTDGSTATAPEDQIAWETIRKAVGGRDLTGGGDLMCVRDQMCKYVHSAYTWDAGKKVLVKRRDKLQPTGVVAIGGGQNGTLKLYFYKLPFKGWLRREDLLGPPRTN